MGFDPQAPKRPTNMTLNEDLVRRSRAFTANLSETVETLLAGFVEEHEREAQKGDAGAAAFIEMHNALVARHEEWAERLW